MLTSLLISQGYLRAVAKASLAPTFGTMEQTAEGLIASLNQFNIKADQSEQVLGSLNRVSKKFAVESADLITAIRKTGAVFALGAGDIEKPIDALHQFNAIFTSVRATTRESADTIGAGLKTIFSRIQRRSSIDALRELGIELTDVKGKFVGFYPALQQIGKSLESVFKSGDSLKLAAITEELGGIRQVGKLIPAIQQYKKAQAALKASQAGAAEGLGKDVNLGLTTLAKSLDIVQAKFQSLIRTLAESTTFKVLLTTFTTIATAAISMVENLKGLIPVIAAVGAIKLAKGAASFGKGFVGGFGNQGGGAAGVGSSLGSKASGAAAKSQSVSLKSLTTSTNALNTTSRLLLASNRDQTLATKGLTVQVEYLLNATTSLIAINKTLAVKNSSGGGALGGGGRGRGRRRGFNHGGIVPGTGNSDTVEANLTPGEFVLTKKAVGAIGAHNLDNMQRQGFAKGGVVGAVNADFGLSVFKKTDTKAGKTIRGGGNSTKKGVLVSALRKDPITREILDGVLRAKISGAAASTSVAVDSLPSGPVDGGLVIAPSLVDSVHKKIGGPKGFVRAMKNSDVRNKLKGQTLSRVASTNPKFPRGARIVAPRMRFSALNRNSKSIFDDSVTSGIPELFKEAASKLKGELSIGEGIVPLSDLLSTSGIGSLKGQLFEAFTRRVGNQVVKDENKSKDELFDFDHSGRVCFQPKGSQVNRPEEAD